MQPILLTLFSSLVGATTAYLVPNPPGNYNVTLTTGPLVDYTRNDPYSETPTPRALMLSVFQPANCKTTVPSQYMPNTTASFQGRFIEATFNISIDLSLLFLGARLPVCPETCSALNSDRILLFSPGYGIPRLYYNILASAIASEGFIVITIDHPGDTNFIAYPDGHVNINPNATTWTNDTFIKSQHVRAQDASFIVDQLSNATAMAELLPHRGPRPFETKQVAILGHSLGGVTAIIAAGQDPRFRGAINWDGTIFGSLPLSGVIQPVIFMGEAGATPEATPSWIAAWPQLKGPKLWANIANTTHETFSDVPTLFEAAGEGTSALADLLGTIEPAKMVRILAKYTAAWMDGAFEGKVGGALLDGEVEGEFPEVETVMKGGF